MRLFIYKWLPIIFGCHCKDERSFHLAGSRFPICARCTGELVGISIVAFTYVIYQPPILWAAILMVPMMIDGGVQLVTRYESNNLKRFISGCLFGYGLSVLFIWTIQCTYQYGQSFAL